MVAETAKRRSILNMVMVALIVVIVIAGVMIVGNLQGWFGSSTGASGSTSMITADKIGYVNIQRSGVSYTLDDDTELQAGDDIETLTGSSISVNFGEGGGLGVNSNTELVIGEADDDGTVSSSELVRGETFVNVASTYTVTFDGDDAQTDSAVYSVDLNSGSKSVDVFAGTVTVGDVAISAGQTLTILTDENGTKSYETEDLAVSSLNDYIISKLQAVADSMDLCFSSDELSSVVSQREEETARAQQESVTGTTITTEDSDSNSAVSDTTLTCTIEIRCDTVLDNMEKLAAGKEIYVPSNGVILATSTVAFNDGDTVYDILSRACDAAGIQLEAAWTPAYNSYYIEGINNLYEFDCGELSGWVYKVNGWIPNYGTSSYYVQDGDTIVLMYTCDGGEDV